LNGQSTPQMPLLFRLDVTALQPKILAILSDTKELVGNTQLKCLKTLEVYIFSITELINPRFYCDSVLLLLLLK